MGDNFRVAEYPRKKQFAEQFTEAMEGRRREQSLGGPVGLLIREMTAELTALGKFNDPRGLYARLPFELRAPELKAFPDEVARAPGELDFWSHGDLAVGVAGVAVRGRGRPRSKWNPRLRPRA